MITLDRRTELIWQAFKLYLPNGTVLKDVIRPPEEQLQIIVKYAKNSGYKFTAPPKLGVPSSWEPALKYVRNHGYDVAAPGSSMHARRYAFDLGRPGASDDDLNDIAEGILKAAANRRITLMPPRGKWPNPKIEHKNRCVHVEIMSAVLDFEPFDYA